MSHLRAALLFLPLATVAACGPPDCRAVPLDPFDHSAVHAPDESLVVDTGISVDAPQHAVRLECADRSGDRRQAVQDWVWVACVFVIALILALLGIDVPLL